MSQVPDRGDAAPSLVRVDPIYWWPGPGPGFVVEQERHVRSTREVNAIGGNADVAGSLSASLSSARAIVMSALLTPGCDALELRYVGGGFTTGQQTQCQVQMFLTAKSYGVGELACMAAEQAVSAAVRALPDDWTNQAAELPEAGRRGESIFELRVPEEITYPQWGHVQADFYYSIVSVRGDGSGWPRFWQAAARQSEPFEISLLFRKTTLAPAELDVVNSIVSQLEFYAETRQDYNLIGQPYLAPGDAGAALALKTWRERVDSLHSPVLARFAVRARPDAAASLAGLLAAALTQSAPVPSAELARPMSVECPLNPADEQLATLAFDAMEVVPWGGHAIWQTPDAPLSLRRMPFLFGSHEAASLALLPVAEVEGAPGFPRPRLLDHRRHRLTTTAPGDGVPLGHVIDQGGEGSAVSIPLTALNRHVLVVGSSGSGKSTTVMSILTRLWEDHRIPFLLIEPVKTEYRGLIRGSFGNDVEVLTIGVDDVAPLRLNPLAPPPGVRLESHLTSVMALFKMAMPLDQPLPLLLEEALERCYRVAGWDLDDQAREGLTAPGLRDLLRTFHETFEEKGYAGEARNLGPAMRVRLQGLLRGAKGKVLDTVESSDLTALLSHPTVVELEAVEDPEEKAFFAGLLIDRVRAQARRRRGSAGRLQHLTVIEEAHRILPAVDGRDRPMGAATDRAAVVESYANAIAELRASGEGFLICSQSPARLARPAISLTSSRILQRLEDAEDRSALLADLDVQEADLRIASRLRVGEAIARLADDDDIVVMKVDPPPGVRSDLEVDDDELRTHSAAQATTNRALLPMTWCSREICQTGCLPSRRRSGATVSARIESAAKQRWDRRQELGDPTPAIVGDARRAGADDAATAYCALSHLHRAGAAFVTITGATDGQVHARRVVQEAFT